MVNTTVKTLEGEFMDDNLIIRIDKELKERFKEAAEKQNPHIAKNKAVSMVIRELMINYVNLYFERKDKKQ